MTKEFIVPMELQSIDSATIDPALWTAIGNPVEEALSLIKITNASDEDIIISYDGIREHEYIVSGKKSVTYFQFNERNDCDTALLAKNTVIYVKGTAGTGYIFVAGYYNG